MARTPRKKVTRRLKKSVRKSLSAVLMITAIAVAAIPVPESYADNGSKNSGIMTLAAGISPRTTGSYAYADRFDFTDPDNDEPMQPMNGWKKDWDKDANKNNTLQQDKDQGIYRTLSVTRLTPDSDSYRLSWRFKFYQVNDSDEDWGVICDYNSILFQNNTVYLDAEAIYDYETVSAEDYQDFKDSISVSGNSRYYEYKLECEPLSKQLAEITSESQKDLWFFEKYFTEEYNRWLNRLEEYRQAINRYNIAHNNWELNGRVGVEPAFPASQRPDEYIIRTSDLLNNETLLRSYYCDIIYGTQKGECSLQQVMDASEGAGGSDPTTKYIYMPKFPEGYDLAAHDITLNILGASLDSLGFIYKSTTPMLAVGPKAFEGVSNTFDLVIHGQYKYIGNEAFIGSSIRSVNFGNVQMIGNRAFKNCTSLESVSFGQTVQEIGNEAFYGCSGLTEIVLPRALTLIGGGAFANCAKLAKIDGRALVEQDPNCTIRDYAFFNDVALQEVNFGSNRPIHTLGKGAFAVDISVTADLLDFPFPNGISVVQPTDKDGYYQEGMGDYILAGRTGLQTVTMPRSFGSNGTSGTTYAVCVPYWTFYNCNGLQKVVFPAGVGEKAEGYDTGLAYYDEYDPDKTPEFTYLDGLFAEVTTEGFYVQGPELNVLGDKAFPRQSTWNAMTRVSDTVPYVFYRNGVRYAEISKDGYLISLNENGIIESIEPRPGFDLDDEIDLEIEAEYGGIHVKGLADNCIDEEILERMRSLRIADDSIESIGAGVFKGCPNLEWVIIGNAVASIGAEAFADCPKLVDVTFNPPKVGYTNFAIGNNAFHTGSPKLMFHGDIVAGYAPFEWAMNQSVYANERQGIRIAYRGLAPSRLLVILDNSTLLPTLVDYQHYNRIDADNPDYIQQQFEYFELQASLSSNGPEYTAAWEQFKKECGDYNTGDYPYSVIKKYEDIYLKGKIPYYDFEQLSPFEESLVEATINVEVPSGVKSIDVYGFYNAEGTSNLNSVAAYDLPGLQAWPSYTDKYADAFYSIDGSHAVVSGNGTDIVPGLFSGNYQDYPTNSELGLRWETETKGNDRIESISLMGVTRLPDYAFDDCERLIRVTLGPDCIDIGTSPFRGCTSIESVVFNNDIYQFDNGIIYKANEAGMLTIVTCLATRGNGNVNTGQPYINLQTDPKLARVNEIAVGAFDSCEYISNVDLTGATNLNTISRGAFKNCNALTFVTLPDNITRIEEEAFYKDDPTTMTVTIYGREVSIRNDAFNHDRRIQLRSYRNSAAERYADTYNLDFVAIDEGWQVIFMDYDGTFLADVQYVDDGKPAAVPDNPIRVGYTFTGWSPTVPGMSTQKITADVTFIAQYSGTGATDGNGNGTGTGTGDGTTDGDGDETDGIYTVTVINGSGSGTYAEGATVSITANAPSTGRTFDRWRTDSLNVSIANVRNMSTTFVMPANNVVVTAVYDSGNGSGSGSGSDSINGSSSGSSGSSSGSASGTGTGSSTGNGTGDSTVGGASSDGSGSTVSITPGIGVSNTGVASATVEGSTDNFVVRITMTPEATAAVERALTKEFGTLDNIRYFPMDITLWDSTGTTQITDTAGISVNITLPIPDDLIMYAGNNKAGAVVGGDTLEKLGTSFKTIDGIPCINFTATHFSPYTIYVDTQNLTAAMDSSPKTGDPIHPKWFLALGLACLSVVLFMKKDKKTVKPA